MPSRGWTAAAVCRDEQGNFLESSALVIHGIHAPTTLESIACKEALSLGKDLLLHNFVVASDSKQVVGDIHNGYQRKYDTIIWHQRFKNTLSKTNRS